MTLPPLMCELGITVIEYAGLKRTYWVFGLRSPSSREEDGTINFLPVYNFVNHTKRRRSHGILCEGKCIGFKGHEHFIGRVSTSDF